MKTKLGLILIIGCLIVFPTGGVFSQEVGVGVGAGTVTGAAPTGAAAGEIPEADIVQLLMQLVPQPPGSSITVIPGQNKLVVRNTPTNLKKIEKFIENLATPPQVAIEAKFVTVGEGTFKDLGFEWSVPGPTGNYGVRWANPIGRDERYSGLEDQGVAWSYDTITASVTSGVTPSVDTEAGLQLTYTSLNYPQFEAILHMLSTREDTKFLSAPTVTTLNNEPATIRFVTTMRYVQDVDIDTETDEDTGVSTTTYDWNWTERDVGIVLYVNPIVIQPTQSVRLFLQPVVSEVATTSDTFTIYYIGDTPFNITIPRFTSRDVTTNVDVHDGTTIVLGGLMNEETTEMLSKIPFLGDIPLIGKAFFQRKANSTERQHLLIFITVNVLDNQGNPFFVKG